MEHIIKKKSDFKDSNVSCENVNKLSNFLSGEYQQ